MISKSPFLSPIQQYQFYDKYSRYDWALGRRQTWGETVDRVMGYLRELSQDKLAEYEYTDLKSAIYNLEVMPSMRLVAMAGDAARIQNAAIYNCGYLSIRDLESFSELLTIIMCGCGVGYSVEKQYIDQLPAVKPQDPDPIPLEYAIPDTSEGWSSALLKGLKVWFSGDDLTFDYSQLRPAGAPLKTKGGTASGPDPLERLLTETKKIVLSRAGGKLTPLDCHDICCLIGDCVVQGGVRRSALIALFDRHDQDMLECKHGDLTGKEHRYNANNSTVWKWRLTKQDISDQMWAMHKGRMGEPAIFSRYATEKKKPARRKSYNHWGTNPCGEIGLRDRQFCNLSIAVARGGDQFADLANKVRLATILGTIQSSAVNFPNLRSEWVENSKAERLLGVDITGQMDCEAVRNPEALSKLKAIALKTNKIYADLLGIEPSAAITCAKPSGNSSVLINSSAGIHARWAPYYIRRVRVNVHSPMYQVLKSSGFDLSPENGQTKENATSFVASFPMKSPKGAICRGDLTALDQLEYWLMVKTYWCEHNPSVTITYKESELEDMIDWIDKHQDTVNGIAFLPIDDNNYEQAPYEKISRQKYSAMVKATPKIDYTLLETLETTDNTTVALEIACLSGVCEI